MVFLRPGTNTLNSPLLRSMRRISWRLEKMMKGLKGSVDETYESQVGASRGLKTTCAVGNMAFSHLIRSSSKPGSSKLFVNKSGVICTDQASWPPDLTEHHHSQKLYSSLPLCYRKRKKKTEKVVYLLIDHFFSANMNKQFFSVHFSLLSSHLLNFF